VTNSDKRRTQKRFAPLIIGIGFLTGALGRFNELMKTGISGDSPDVFIVLIMFVIGIGGLVMWFRQ
jgi:hypothetical protein